MDRPCREMTFEEETKFYEEEARAEFAKETGNDDSAGVNNILRRGMRIIRKARQEIANRAEVVYGQWEDFCGDKMCRCSVCKAEFDNTVNDIHSEWKHCPNCGADMRGDHNG